MYIGVTFSARIFNKLSRQLNNLRFSCVHSTMELECEFYISSSGEKKEKSICTLNVLSRMRSKIRWNFEASFGRKSFRNPFERVIIERLCCVRGAHTVHIWYNRKRGTCLELLVKAESRFEWKMSRNLVHQFVFFSLCEQRIGIRFYIIPFLEFTH